MRCYKSQSGNWVILTADLQKAAVVDSTGLVLWWDRQTQPIKIEARLGQATWVSADWSRYAN